MHAVWWFSLWDNVSLSVSVCQSSTINNNNYSNEVHEDGEGERKFEMTEKGKKVERNITNDVQWFLVDWIVKVVMVVKKYFEK